MKVLRLGSSGVNVKVLQQALKNKGYDILVDSFFGRATEVTLIQFQKHNGLYPDGIAGPKTWAALGYKIKSGGWIAIHVSASPELDARFNAEWIVNYHTKMLGWDRPGYSRIIEYDGSVKDTWNVDVKDGIQANEKTYGIGGWRDNAAINICLVGGLDKAGNVKDTRTPQQLESLRNLVFSLLEDNDSLKVVGHNQIYNKACPCFSVPKWAKHIGLPDSNIEFQDPFGYVEYFKGMP